MEPPKRFGVIKHVDLQNPGSLGQPASQPDISFTRRRAHRKDGCARERKHKPIDRLPAEKYPEEKLETR